MATANVIELKACMKDCLAYCEANNQHDFVEYHHPRLIHSFKKFNDAVEISDRFFRVFANASIDDKKAWKAVSQKVRSIQKGIERYEIHHYPKNIILYWDLPLFRGHVKEMLDWLNDNQDAYPEASSDRAELQRLCDSAEKARKFRDDSLEEYARQAQFRSSALGGLAIYLSEFRQTLRRNLGEQDPNYLSIQWPFSLSPDRPVLL